MYPTTIFLIDAIEQSANLRGEEAGKELLGSSLGLLRLGGVLSLDALLLDCRKS